MKLIKDIQEYVKRDTTVLTYWKLDDQKHLNHTMRILLVGTIDSVTPDAVCATNKGAHYLVKRDNIWEERVLGDETIFSVKISKGYSTVAFYELSEGEALMHDVLGEL